jgi:hypothetical protein
MWQVLPEEEARLSAQLAALDAEHYRLDPAIREAVDEPLHLGLFVRKPPAFQPGRALVLDWSSRFSGKEADPDAWQQALLRPSVGEPPMRYLANRRMQVAAQRVKGSHEPIARIAFETGYESEAAFNRAFKRAFRMPPATWGKQHSE